MKVSSIGVCSLTLAFLGSLGAAVIDTTNAATVAAFQAGATVVNFESVAGRTPQTITSYTQGDAVSANSLIFDHIPGVQFSVGGTPGINSPALFTLSGGIAGDAHSPSTVLAPVDMQDGTTKFGPGVFIEVFFPTKVSKVGFRVNPSLGNLFIIALNTNFAFSGEVETNLESGNVTAGNFVGIERASAEIGGFKIFGLGDAGFSIDDLTFGGATSAIPEPGTLALLAGGLFILAFRRVRS